MTWIVDILLIVVIAVAGYIGYKRGIVKMLLSFLTIIIALVLAFMISSPLADLSYGWFFEESVSNTVDAALENATMNTVEQSVENLFGAESIIGGLGNLVGFDTQAAMEQITGDSLEEIARVIKEDIIAPPMVLLLQAVLFVLLFVLLWILLAIVAKALNHTTKLPVIKGVNAVFGAVVGVVIGIVLCFALCALINLAMKINPEGLFGITQVTRENSIVYRFISDTFLTF